MQENQVVLSEVIVICEPCVLNNQEYCFKSIISSCQMKLAHCIFQLFGEFFASKGYILRIYFCYDPYM